MADHIKRLIAEGEHQMLDFKFEVSDFYKIARILVAFSNTDGGRLLIGVKDNGAIAGVRSEEEYFMLEGAARLYCRPEVPFRIKEWIIDGRKVLEAVVRPGVDKPYLAKDPGKKWLAYIRQADQIFKASAVQLRVWGLEKSGEGTFVRFREAERLILSQLERNHRITMGRFKRLAGITYARAEETMVNFIMLGLVRIRYTETGDYFELTGDYEEKLGSLGDVL